MEEKKDVVKVPQELLSLVGALTIENHLLKDQINALTKKTEDIENRLNSITTSVTGSDNTTV